MLQPRKLVLLSKAEISRRWEKIKLLVPFGPNGEYYWNCNPEETKLMVAIPPSDFFRFSFLGIETKPVKEPGSIEEVARILTLHSITSLFYPSVAEVLSQIPVELVNSVDYFCTLHEAPQRLCEEGRYYEATTILYRVAS